MRSEDLKPCPICGYPAELRRDIEGYLVICSNDSVDENFCGNSVLSSEVSDWQRPTYYEIKLEQALKDRQELIEVVKFYAKTTSWLGHKIGAHRDEMLWGRIVHCDLSSAEGDFDNVGGKRAREVLKKMGVEVL